MIDILASLSSSFCGPFFSLSHSHVNVYPHAPSECRLIGISDIQEAVWVLSLLVDFRHQCVSLQNVSAIYKEVQGVLLGKSDTLADNEAKLVSSRCGLRSSSKLFDFPPIVVAPEKASLSE